MPTQAPTYSQSFNRYSYVWNNPLNLIDPSGYAVKSSGQGDGGDDGAAKETETVDEEEKIMIF